MASRKIKMGNKPTVGEAYENALMEEQEAARRKEMEKEMAKQRKPIGAAPEFSVPKMPTPSDTITTPVMPPKSPSTGAPITKLPASPSKGPKQPNLIKVARKRK